MKITIELDGTEGHDQLTAIAAYFDAALGDYSRYDQANGRVPKPARVVVEREQSAGVTVPTSDDLIEAEAARAASPVATTDSAPETDNTGLPWDERIHSSSKAINADGTWRARRGVDEAIVASVTAELRGSQPPAPPVAESEASVPVPPTPSPSQDEQQPPAPPVTPAPAATASDTPAATTAAKFDGFPAFVKAINAARKPDGSGYVYDELNTMAKDVGADKFVALKDMPDKWDMFADLVGA